jgi:hypothetical protein
MERLHLRPPQDARIGRDCEFCRHSDPDFEKRNPLDRLVCYKQDTATAHMSENGYVRHLMLEIEIRLGVTEFALLPSVA